MPEPTLIHIVGNRPQFIKLAVLYNAIKEYSSFRQFIIHTGQHSSKEMSEIFFHELMIPAPDLQLDIKAHHPDEFTGKAAARIEYAFSEKKNDDLVLVYGDTNSTLAGALAAKRSRKKLLHFESGVRTPDTSMPEEINRVLTDRLSDVHYCCTENNKTSLINEGFGKSIPGQVIWTGDLMLDAFLLVPQSEKRIIASKEYIACTIHRAGNIINPHNLREIVTSLNFIHKETEVVIPLHPHTAKRLKEYDLKLNCTTIDPLGYKEMKRFIADSSFVITDSGGACREAFFSAKRTLIIMEYPFWPEIVQSGAALNCKPDLKEILKKFGELKLSQPHFDINIFGDGCASKNIALHLNSLHNP